jgi:hypothetical protein
MLGDPEVENLPSSVADHEPDVQQTKLNGGHIARCILHGITAYCETESSSGSGLPSVVDRSSVERKSPMIPGRTDIENRQGVLRNQFIIDGEFFDLLAMGIDV